MKRKVSKVTYRVYYVRGVGQKQVYETRSLQYLSRWLSEHGGGLLVFNYDVLRDTQADYLSVRVVRPLSGLMNEVEFLRVGRDEEGRNLWDY
jgi:hypothetical protein